MSAYHVGVLSLRPSLDELINVQQDGVDEDEILRRASYPHSLPYVLRAANMTYAEIGCLLDPYSVAQAGKGPGSGSAASYWWQLRDAGVPPHCLPQSLRNEMSPVHHMQPSRHEADFGNSVMLRHQQSRIPPSPAQQQHAISFQQRFGSPIRPFPSLDVPPSTTLRVVTSWVGMTAPLPSPRFSPHLSWFQPLLL